MFSRLSHYCNCCLNIILIIFDQLQTSHTLIAMTNPELEEKLREAACFGDLDGVKELVNKGVNVNSQHDINGWTALHWAAKRNHLNIVNKLLNHGADKSIKTNKGELAASLTSEGVIKVILLIVKYEGVIIVIQVLLSATNSSPSPSPAPVKREEKLAITPNYIRHPPLAYKVDTGDSGVTEQVQEKRPRLETPVKHTYPPASKYDIFDNYSVITFQCALYAPSNLG